jgi:hypothetical protein
MSMPFSTEEQIKKAEKFLTSVQKPVCNNCARGVSMCYHTPCIGTVDDMERLIDAGYAKNLMLDFWTGRSSVESGTNKAFGVAKRVPNKKDSIISFFEEDVMYLAPATVGKEGQISGFNKGGTCNLLKDNKCSLHDLGLKPTQGQYACCSIDRAYMDEFGKQRDLDERLPILITWNTQRGKDLIERWKKEVNFTGPEKEEFPNDFGSMMQFMFEALGSHEKTKDRMKTGGCPEVSDEHPQIYTHTYEKPY